MGHACFLPQPTNRFSDGDVDNHWIEGRSIDSDRGCTGDAFERIDHDGFVCRGREDLVDYVNDTVAGHHVGRGYCGIVDFYGTVDNRERCLVGVHHRSGHAVGDTRSINRGPNHVVEEDIAEG